MHCVLLIKNYNSEEPECEGTHLVSNVELPRSVEVEYCVERPGVPFIGLSLFTRAAFGKDYHCLTY